MIRTRLARRPQPQPRERALGVMRAFIRTLERIDGRPPSRPAPEGRR